eukprot:1161810-Pelagomonas_calceolata.AAC.5
MATKAMCPSPAPECNHVRDLQLHHGQTHPFPGGLSPESTVRQSDKKRDGSSGYLHNDTHKKGACKTKMIGKYTNTTRQASHICLGQ